MALAPLVNTARGQSKSGGKLKGFGAPEGGTSLPGFGRFEESLPAVIEQDRAYAQDQITSFDRDKDGSLDRDEIRRTGYKGIESRWFAFDRDDDGRLVARELALSYAKTRFDKERKLRSQAAAKLRASRISVSSADKSNAASYVARFDRNKIENSTRTSSPLHGARTLPRCCQTTTPIVAVFSAQQSSLDCRSRAGKVETTKEDAAAAIRHGFVWKFWTPKQKQAAEGQHRRLDGNDAPLRRQWKRAV
jgi:hypothetical protein